MFELLEAKQRRCRTPYIGPWSSRPEIGYDQRQCCKRATTCESSYRPKGVDTSKKKWVSRAETEGTTAQTNKLATTLRHWSRIRRQRINFHAGRNITQQHSRDGVQDRPADSEVDHSESEGSWSVIDIPFAESELLSTDSTTSACVYGIHCAFLAVQSCATTVRIIVSNVGV